MRLIQNHASARNTIGGELFAILNKRSPGNTQWIPLLRTEPNSSSLADERYSGDKEPQDARRLARCGRALLVRLIGGSGVDRIAYHRVRRPEELRVALNRPNRFGSDSNFRLFVFHGYHPLFL